MAVGTVTTARFIVTGVGLTAQSRDLMCDGDWKKALALLTGSLEGVSYEQAISILEGKFRLEGEDGEVRLFPETPETTRALQERYQDEYGMGGFVKRGNRMYQAYCVIDNLGPDDTRDLRLMREQHRLGQGHCPDWADRIQTVHAKACFYPLFPHNTLEIRGMFYARRPETDFAKMVKNGLGKWVVVLFEETTEGITPFWREKENVDAQAAYNQVAEYLPVFGFAQRFGATHPDAAPKGIATVVPPPLAILLDEGELALNLEAGVRDGIARDAAFNAECISLRDRICTFADNDLEYGWFTYVWHSSTPGIGSITLKAPHRALICYALSKTCATHLMPKYALFSPEGMKMPEDNPYHTEVWLGCGLEIDMDTYNHHNPQFLAFTDMMFDIQKQILDFEVQVLARGARMTGTVVYHDSDVIDKGSILVIPHAGVDFELQALKAGAVICEVGGKLAHLVTVCRERATPILRMDNALSKLKQGQRVTVIPQEGKVEIHASWTQTF